MRSDIVYLAVPYSDPDPAVMAERFRQANIAAGEMMDEGVFVLCPISHCHPIAVDYGTPRHYKYWEAYNRALMQKCCRVVVLRADGWKDSIGVTAEIKYAKQLGLEVTYQ